MKKILLLLLLITTVAFGQNQTFTGVKTFTSPPVFQNLLQDDSQVKILGIDSNGKLNWRSASTFGIPDAPSNGLSYLRKNGSWFQFSASIPNLQQVTDIGNNIINNTGITISSTDPASVRHDLELYPYQMMIYYNNYKDYMQYGMTGIESSRPINRDDSINNLSFVRFSPGVANWHFGNRDGTFQVAAVSDIPSITGLAPLTYVDAQDATKQNTLVSGTNIKTINGNSLLGTGDIVVSAGGAGDMLKSVYDTTNSGIVDKAESLMRYVYAQEFIAKGDPVYVEVTGNPTFVKRAQSNNLAKMPAFGVAVNDINAGSIGLVVITGAIYNLNTNGFVLGKNVYVGATGGLTSTRPLDNPQPMGIVIRQGGTDGVIAIEPQEIINVDIANVNGLRTELDALAGTSQINADWNAETGVAKILNKPALIPFYNDVNKYNLGIGDEILSGLATGELNTGIGSGTLFSNTLGGNNTAIGTFAMYYNITGNFNTAIGDNALTNNTIGVANTAIGSFSQNAGTSASYNVSVGENSLASNVYGGNNIAIGSHALYKNIGTQGSNIFGHRSTAIGISAMYENTTGNGVAIGELALGKNTTGVWNIGVGFQAGSGITTGAGNVVLASTGFVAAGGGITTGNNNMILAPNNGNATGITTGSGNVVVGKVSGLAATLTNNIVLADGAGTVRAQHNGTSWNINSPIVATQYNIPALNTAPASATATGTLGEVRYTATHIYVCIATNTWVRAALSTW